MTTPPGYRAHSPETLPDYLAGIAAARDRLGGDPARWTVREVGDGNLNLVFIVESPGGGLAVKQALPYVRLVGEAWPLPLSRAHYEHMALTRQADCAPGLTPEVVHYDADLALIAMELLSPHIIMRRGMIDGVIYPRAADALSTFAARTLFLTSDLALKAADKKALVGAFSGNTALCKITEDLIFTEPYRIAANNRWTAPQLDGWARAIREDGDLKVAVSRLKLKFMTAGEALLHGDLHTGSVMLTAEDTRVIDPEFAFVGPMGFDLGAVLANLLISYLSQSGHEAAPGARDAYRAFVLGLIDGFWTGFRAKFLALWRSDAAAGDGYPQALFQGPAGQARLQIAQAAHMDALWRDAVGFAGAKIIRRILGLAHNLDFEAIADPGVRATAEARALGLARAMIVSADSFCGVEALIEAAKRANAQAVTLEG